MKFIIRLALSLLALSALPAAAAGATEIKLEITGPAEMVYRWDTMHCEAWDIPDAPARAWRDQAGRTHLIAAHTNNRVMSGADLLHLQPDCHVAFKGGERDAPERYDDRSWISSIYTLDGSTIFALVHNEFHGHLRPQLCPDKAYLPCWRNTVTAVVSHDGGATFALQTPNFAAGLPYRYEAGIGHQSGYFNPSNIVQRNGFFYVFFWAEPLSAQRRGVCVMRTQNLADSRSWRAWDGSDFTIRFADPYREPIDADAKHVCAPVAPASFGAFISSVTLHRPSGLYVALTMANRAPAPGQPPVSGIFAATSADLVHWSDASLVKAVPALFRFACTDHDVLFYPALLDPASTSRNFEDFGDRAYVFATAIHPQDCKIGNQRDLIRLPVSAKRMG